MANEKKSIIEEALLEAEKIDATFKSNAKEILAHTMSSEIEEMVKESLTGSKKRRLKEDEEEETDLNLDLDSDEGTENLDLDIDTDMDSEEDESEDEEGAEDLDLEDESEEGEDDEVELDVDSEEGDLDLDLGGEGEFDLDGLNLGGDNADLDLGLGGEEGEVAVDTVDLTGASDSDVISVFKKMGPEDEIEVVNDNGMVTLKDNKSGSEYRIELNTGTGVPSVEAEEIQLGESKEDSKEVIYEIEVDDEDEMSDYMEDNMSDYMENGMKGNWGSKKHEYKRKNGHKTGNVDGHYKDYEDDMSDCMSDYMSRTSYNQGPNGKPFHREEGTGHRRTPNTGLGESSIKSQKLIKENTNLTVKNSTLETENKELKENHEKMVDALKQFRKKLQEVAVFNSNLTYAVRLFTENSTTKEEKNEILKRLDSAKTLKESQSIYKQLVKEYSTGKAPIKESIDEKINKTATSGAQISEQSVFVHPELQSMKKLWEYSYKK